MAPISTSVPVAVVGAGAMGTGIAQIAATAGHEVLLHDARAGAADKAAASVAAALDRLVERGRMTRAERDATCARLKPCAGLADLARAGLVIEAIVEELEPKRSLFGALEGIVGADAILASNTSSLSIAAMARGLARPQRVAGMHFFNPAPLMALVEIVHGPATAPQVAQALFDTAAAWGKAPVLAASTPGFIVNRCARPFYGEAWRLLGERSTDAATLDAILRECGGFRMGPCELMDLIGHDVNLAVTRSVFEAYAGDPRYRPSPLQQLLVDAGQLGRKSGRGLFDHRPGAAPPAPRTEPPAPPPTRAVIEGDLGPAGGLVARLRQSGVPHGHAQRDEGAIVLDGAVLHLTDGRTAAERAASHEHNLVLFDLALDYTTAKRIAVAPAPQANPAARDAAVGFFQALGFQVCVVDDTPGLVVARTVAMLANEATEAVLHGVAEPAAIDLAMTKSVNYPLGPLAWAESVGPGWVLTVLDNLARNYGDDRYRASLELRRRVAARRHLLGT